MTLTIPPMPNWDDFYPQMPDKFDWSGFSDALETWGRHGWAEAERLEAEKASHEDAHWHMVGQYNRVESERDEARAEVERLKADLDAYKRDREILTSEIRCLRRLDAQGD